MLNDTGVPIGRRVRAGYVLVVSDVTTVHALWQVECVRCGAVVCEVTPHTIALSTWWWLDTFHDHEAHHANDRRVLEVIA